MQDERALQPQGTDILVSDWVWIGANVFISPSVSIGDNTIIGAHSVVTATFLQILCRVACLPG